MTDAEKREAARQFYQKWVNKGKEDEDDRSYWLDFLQRIMGISDATDRIEFQKKVIGADGNTKRIDAYIPETKVLIEQKSLGIALDKSQAGHDGMTPYEQAKMYDNGLPHNEKAKWIITSNFNEIWIYDMDDRKPEPKKLELADLLSKYSMLDFLVKKDVEKVSEEVALSKEAGILVGKIHDRFLEKYNDPMAKRTQNSLNILCVRLVFCLYAEDAGLFGEKDAFKNYIEQFAPGKIRNALLELFKVLNTPLDERAELYLDEDIAKFPYVNGGLFAREHIEIPLITQEIKDTLIESSLFDWSRISPTIFGAVFESTLNLETRRQGGMHYTSIEDIHKVIDPLFLDDLKEELKSIKQIQVKNTRDKKLRAYQDKLSSLRWLDPACGSGNFLTETYVSIRRLENEVISLLHQGQISFGFEEANPIKVGIDQFYGIEINDFAVTVAKTALWISESQMMKETEDVVHMNLDFLPLKTNANIVEGNALQLDWSKIIKKNELSFICGNPPFSGVRTMTSHQKKDVLDVFGKKWKSYNSMDYVACWYKKASEYIQDTNITCGFVSTNSIVQGEQVPALWKPLFEEYNIKINYAYQTFVWNSEAQLQAKVHCVIIGFSANNLICKRKLFTGNNMRIVENVNAYLNDAPSIFIERQNKPICEIPEIYLGCTFNDNNHLIMNKDEKDDFLNKYPNMSKYIRPYVMGKDFIARKPRYCFWLKNADISDIRKCSDLMERINLVREFRLTCKNDNTLKTAETPMLPSMMRYYNKDANKPFVAIPKVSSQRRRYIPMEMLSSDYIAGDKIFLMPDADLYSFGILTSNVHMSWMRVFGGRLKSDYSYSSTIVYNTLPWPDPTNDQKIKIEQTAQGILDARALYPDSSLADLYDPLTMPPELRKAHQQNDKAVMQAYGMSVKDTSEADCVAWLMRMYQELTKKTDKESQEKPSKRAKKKQ